MVFVQILGIDGVVNAVVRRRNDDIFQNPHFANVNRMIPKLREQMQRRNHRNDLRRNPQQRSGQQEKGK